jgi:hypothetical protein
MSNGIIALVINERSVRDELTSLLGLPPDKVRSYPTATDAMMSMPSTPFAAIIVDAMVFPGLGSDDPEVHQLALLIPDTKMNKAVLYWQVALRLIKSVRATGSRNENTPLVFIFPDLPLRHAGMGADQLTREAVDADLQDWQPAVAVYGKQLADVAELTRRYIVDQAASDEASVE